MPNQDVNKKSRSASNVALGGFAWSFAERIGAQLVTLLVSVILARLLGPEEYAVIAIVQIFVIIADVFVTAGFGSALVQKLNADELDFSTTFFFSLVFSAGVYLLLFFAAPVIADFYDMQVLVPVIRVMAIRIILASVNSVQQAYVSKTLQFRKFFFSTLWASVVSAVVGIAMAYAGFGVWALVAQYLSNVAIGTVVLSVTGGWKPKGIFSWERMKSLFSYGWKVMLASVAHSLGQQMRSLVLSKTVSPVDLSYYNQGDKFPALFINNIETSIQKVLAPIISKEQENLPRVLDLTRKSMRIATFTIWPLLIGLAAVADSLIELLYTSKWLGSVPYMKLICLAYLLYPVGETHVRTIRALGRSDVTMKTVLSAEAVNVAFLVLAILIGAGGKGIVVSWIISSVAMAILNGIADYRLTGYRLTDQILDVASPAVCSAIMYIVVQQLAVINMGLLFKLGMQILVGVIVYVGCSLLINRKTCCYVWGTMMSFVRKGK